MTWPQVVMLLYIAFCVIWAVVENVRDRTQSSTQATCTIFIVIAAYVGLALVLHAGRFW